MNDEFDEIDREFDREFDRAFKKAVRMGAMAAVAVGLVWLALLGAVGWLAFTLLQHFEVI